MGILTTDLVESVVTILLADLRTIAVYAGIPIIGTLMGTRFLLSLIQKGKV